MKWWDTTFVPIYPTFFFGLAVFSLFLVRGAKGRENYVWTLWPAFRVTKECNNCSTAAGEVHGMQLKKHLSSDTVLFCVACARTGKLS